MKHIYIFDDEKAKQTHSEILSMPGCVGWIKADDRKKDDLIEDIEYLTKEKYK